MKHLAWPLGFVLFLAFAAGANPSFAQAVNMQPPSSVSYLSQGRYLIFQGNYLNAKGDAESGLVKFDSQTGLTWLLQPAPATHATDREFCWVPIKN